jgi:hypothetical protein
LDKIIKAGERRAKLLGLDKPQQIEFSRGPRVIGQNPAEVLAAAQKRLQQRKQES